MFRMLATGFLFILKNLKLYLALLLEYNSLGYLLEVPKVAEQPVFVLQQREVARSQLQEELRPGSSDCVGLSGQYPGLEAIGKLQLKRLRKGNKNKRL